MRLRDLAIPSAWGLAAIEPVEVYVAAEFAEVDRALLLSCRGASPRESQNLGDLHTLQRAQARGISLASH